MVESRVQSVCVGAVALLGVSVFLWIAEDAGRSAWAQDTTRTTSVAKNKGGWSLDCADQGSGADCQVSQTMTVKETGQRILMVVVKKDRQSGSPHVLLALPHKIFLPAGIILQVDSQLPKELDIETCDERACYASAQLAQGFVTTMQSGAAMHVTFQNLLRKPVTFSVPLTGFQPAYTGLK
ncbi:MAG: invasion associated locus B family protein [Hyphomicrobiales bacterium]